ncbi:MAG: L-histidine N(alpha)-methyltransferase [Alphaproteobacteria bacterium]|nr:L-histidine N(alpha)-methyltransferase [Alphaproteobacteria bacterium]
MTPAQGKLDLREGFDEAGAIKDDFRRAVLEGLGQRPKWIPCKYLYDARGSALFEEICKLDEYYPTRTELALLHRHSDEIASLVGPNANVIEFGSGSSRKIRILLDTFEKPAAYVSVDISREHLLQEAQRLAVDYDGLSVIPIHADYTQGLEFPASVFESPRVGFFPGSNIGNFAPADAFRFLQELSRSMGEKSGFLVGVDLKKDERILAAAYNDARGITAAFNTNLLVRINRELAGDFDLAGFVHEAPYNAEKGRIEMHLKSVRPQTVRVEGHRFAFAEGETIHTESSYKYAADEFQALAEDAGWRPVACWQDPNRLFSLHYLETA